MKTKSVAKKVFSGILAFDFEPLMDQPVTAMDGSQGKCVGGTIGEKGVEIAIADLTNGEMRHLQLEALPHMLIAAGMSSEEAQQRMNALESNLTPAISAKPFRQRRRGGSPVATVM